MSVSAASLPDKSRMR